MTNDHGADKSEPTWLHKGSTDSKDVEAFYDDWAATYEQELSGWRYTAPDEAAERLAALIEDGAALLDVGCGTGMFGERMRAAKPVTLTGIDISDASLKRAEAKGVYAELKKVDLQQTPLPFEAKSMDAAASIGVMTYIEEPKALLSDLARIVRPGGPILFTQRDDRWDDKGFDAVLAALEAEGLTGPAAVSEPRPYLPDHDEFGEEVLVRHVLLTVK
jgi:predicted TPR repeat methyltransferase